MIRKETSAKGKSVKVTFELPADAAQDKVAVVGDFNDWSESKNTLKLDKKAKSWKGSVSLKPGQAYRFRYLVDGEQWRNDDAADRLEYNSYGSQDCVIEV